MNIKFLIEKTRLRIFKRSRIFKFPIKIVDKSSFFFMYEEIFNKEIYKFNSEKENPLIIDCGANIGLSTIYFKKIYSNSTIISFEPDKYIFDILQSNINSLGLKNVTLINKGLSDHDGVVNFFSEGADGGRVALETDNKNINKIEVTKLSSYLDEEIDFLKIDIEGSEINVIKEISNKLHNIKNIFIEYHSASSKKQELDVILKILSDNGFRYYIDRVGVESERPFVKINEYSGYDLQLNISGVKDTKYEKRQ